MVCYFKNKLRFRIFPTNIAMIAPVRKKNAGDVRKSRFFRKIKPSPALDA
jgi:hypothetical protein